MPAIAIVKTEDSLLKDAGNSLEQTASGIQHFVQNIKVAALFVQAVLAVHPLNINAL